MSLDETIRSIALTPDEIRSEQLDWYRNREPEQYDDEPEDDDIKEQVQNEQM